MMPPFEHGLASGAGPTLTEISRHISESADQTLELIPVTRGLREITAEELLNRCVEHIPCLMEPILQQTGLAALAGSSDTGKSAFLRQLALAVTTGQTDFLGFTIKARYRSCIYVSTEDDELAMSFLLNAYRKCRAINPSECSTLRFLFYAENLLQELDLRLSEQPADLVILDAFGDLYTREQNSSNQIRAFLQGFSLLAVRHKCLFLFLHHVGKRTENELPSKHNLIGGQGFEGKMRVVLELRRDATNSAIRHLCVVKGNYLADEWKEKSFVLSFQDFVFTNTGQRIPFELLGRQNDDDSWAKYQAIQAARADGLKGDALAEKCGISKSQISKIEKRFSTIEQPQLPL